MQTDWTAWCRHSLAEEDVVRLILDGTVVWAELDRKATSISLLPLLAGPPPPSGLDVRRIVIVAAAIAVVFHGLHFPAEAHIRATAFRVVQMLAICQSDDARL